MENRVEGYDIIGDIHGCASKLEELLKKLGYSSYETGSDKNVFYTHKQRKAIFVGDFIDRGTEQLKLLNMVMAMAKNGSALAVMGNHEFNAIGFHTPKPDCDGEWLRERSTKNIRQHQAYLNDLDTPQNMKKHTEVLEFFRSLPLWLDLGELRVIHACWSEEQMQVIKPLLKSDNTLSKDAIYESNSKGSAAYNAVEILLKGMEYTPGNGFSFNDKDGNPRQKLRVKWWLNNYSTLRELALPEALNGNNKAAQTHVPANVTCGYPAFEPPVFFGHYWMEGRPQILADNVACVDYSVANDGKLVAYRWSGEQKLSNDNFVFI